MEGMFACEGEEAWLTKYRAAEKKGWFSTTLAHLE